MAALGAAVSLWAIRLVHGAWTGADTGACRRAVALFLPVAYTLFLLSVGNRYEWQEVNRLRFILDPIWWAGAMLYRRYGSEAAGAAASVRNVASSG